MQRTRVFARAQNCVLLLIWPRPCCASSLDAFARLDVQAALAILKEDHLIDREFAAFVQKLAISMAADPRTIAASLDLLFLGKAIERIGDHAKNIAEFTIYVVRGEDVRHASMDTIESVLR